MRNQRMRCSIANHKLKGNGVQIKNPELVAFVKSIYPDFRPQEKVCRECKKFLNIIYAYKQRKEIRKRHKANLNSSSNSSSCNTTSSSSVASLANLINTQGNEKNSNSQNQSSTTDEIDSDQPTTSLEASERQRRRRETARCGSTSENLIVLPHVQPRVKRRDFITLTPEVMRNYLKGILGG